MKTGHLYKWLLLFLVASVFAQTDDELETENDEESNSTSTMSNDDSDFDDPIPSTTVTSSVRPKQRYKAKPTLKRGSPKQRLTLFRLRDWKLARSSEVGIGAFLVRGPPSTPNGSGCHGAIIENEKSLRYFITTGSCISVFHDLEVKIGDDLEQNKFTKYKVTRLMPFETYNNDNEKDDISIVQLSPVIRQNSLAQAIKMSTELPKLDHKCKTYSWNESLEPEFMQEKDVTIVACDESVSANYLTESSFCIKSESEPLCTGDFGIPIVCDDLLYGIVTGLFKTKSESNCRANKALCIGVANYLENINQMIVEMDKQIEEDETSDEIETLPPDDGAASLTVRQYLLALLFLLFRL